MLKFNDPRLNLAWENRDKPMSVVSIEGGLIHYKGPGFIFTVYYGDTPFNEIVGGEGFVISDYVDFSFFEYGSRLPAEFSITEIPGDSRYVK